MQDTLVGGGSGDADNTPAYNQTGCCRAAGILPQCMRLCTFDLKLSEMTELSQTCQPQVGNYRQRLKPLSSHRRF